jgi:predicted lipid-binding transport protein (Tim44 family)
LTGFMEYGILYATTKLFKGASMNQAVNRRWKTTVVIFTLFFIFFIGMETFAHARAGGGRSSGSRGFSSGSGSRSSQGTTTTQPTQQPGMTQPTPTQPTSPGIGRSLLYGIGGGLVGGMIGSMLFGGRAGAGGWGGGGGFGFGDLIIILVIVAIVFFVIKRFRARKAMEMSSAGAAYAPSSYSYNEPAAAVTSFEPPSREGAISQGLRHISEMDSAFNEASFKESIEDNFFKIQSAWTKRDLGSVKNLLTPQMLNTFQDDVNRFIANKQFNRLENIAVRQVDIVDAVQDQGEDYITVKFLASLLDYVVDETTGQTASGSTSEPVKFLEYWTFNRKVGEKNWLLAGITQEGDYR